jgi:hypothetical protein
MSQVEKKRFGLGAGMMIVFLGVMVAIFMPLFDGKNGLDYLDSLYNSISKGSAYYIPALQETNKKYAGKAVSLSLSMKDADEAERSAKILGLAGAKSSVTGQTVTVEGDLGAIVGACLDDTQHMFDNNGDALSTRYQMDERLAQYTWWSILSAMDKALKRGKQFDEATFLSAVKKKGVECAYNYYRIEPQSIGDRWGIVVASLLFYVLYTVWYGFAVLFMFEGAGLRLEH